MLQTFRDNMKGTMAIIIISLMIIPFAMFGVDSLFLQDNTAGTAAEINGEVISEVELSRAIQMQKQQLLERFGDQAPAELLSDEKLRQPVLDRLIQRSVIESSAYSGGMTASDRYLDQMILGSPQFKQNGKFSPELYSQLLRSSGYTPTSYKKLLIQDIVVSQHIAGISDSAFVTDTDVDKLIALSQQTRNFHYLTLPFAQAETQVTVTEEQIQDFYDNNQAQFMSTEQVSIQYIELSLESLAALVEVTEEQIKAQFDENSKSFTGDTTRQVAHILVELKDDGSEQEVIREIQAKLDLGEDFASLVTAYSDDLGSKDVGGDLGVTDGSTFPEAFEAALVDLKIGEVSSAVETDAGFHFIKLLDEQQAEAPSFAQNRDAIKQEIALAQAESEFVELLDALPDATYNATDLVEAANSLGLEVKTSSLFGRDGGEGITGNNQVLATVFDDDVLHNGAVSDLIELGDDHIVVVRLAEYKPSAIKELSDVSSEIKARLRQQTASELLRIRAEELEKKIASVGDVEKVAVAEGLEWQVALKVNRAQTNYDQDLLAYVFSQGKPMDAPITGSLMLSNNDYVITQLSAVAAGQLPAMAEVQKARLVEQLSQQQGNAELSLFEADKRALASVTIY
jgi:peptidyl-prolyl cis-trans isomerase D